MNHSLESLDKEDSDVGVVEYLSRNELLLDYMKSDSRLVCSAERRVQLDVELEWIEAWQILDSVKWDDV